MKGNKDNIFKDINLDKVNIYKMKHKTLFLVLNISIFIVMAILKYKHKVDGRVLEFLMITDMVLLMGAWVGGLGLNNTIHISNKSINLGNSEWIPWKNMKKIEFKNTFKSMAIVIHLKDLTIIKKNILVISNKKELRDDIELLCTQYNTEYFNEVKENWFIYEWWNIFKVY